MEANLCVLIDFENIGTGCDKEGLGVFDVRMVMRRLKDKGRILVSRAYADWTRWSRFKQDLVFSGVNMMELTAHGMGAKNRADIALVVDAMEIAYTRDYIDTFVILSGDSDFTPLVMRLKELNKRVIGLGTKGSTSRLIAETCDEFMFYDTLRREQHSEASARPDSADQGSLTRDEAFDLLIETLENQAREDGAPIHASILKTSMKRKAPTFSEVDLGFRTFAVFLETAQERGLVRMFRDDRAGGFRVELPREERATPQLTSQGPVGEGERRLLGRLSELGCDFGTLTDRTWVTEQFVAACQERGRRGRTCAVEYLIGDLLRRARTDRTAIPPRVVKGVLNTLLRAGSFRGPDGETARTSTAPFQPPESAELLRQRLTVHARALLAEAGDTLDATTVFEVFGNGAPRKEPSVESADPAEAAASVRPTMEDGGDDAGDGSDGPQQGDAPTGRRRRRRRRRGPGEHSSEQDGASSEQGGDSSEQGGDSSEHDGAPGEQASDQTRAPQSADQRSAPAPRARRSFDAPQSEDLEALFPADPIPDTGVLAAGDAGEAWVVSEDPSAAAPKRRAPRRTTARPVKK